MNGKKYVRSVPSRVRQTKATKARAGEFGRASGLGKVIRGQLESVIPAPKDNNMQTRLVTSIYRWLLDWKDQNESKKVQPWSLVGFQFHLQSNRLAVRWKTRLDIRIDKPGQVQILIPSFVPTEAIMAPKDTVSVVCRIATCVSDTGRKFPLGSDDKELVFEYGKKPVPAKTIAFDLLTPSGSLVLTGVSLEYRVSVNGYVSATKNKNYMPSEIVDAKYV